MNKLPKDAGIILTDFNSEEWLMNLANQQKVDKKEFLLGCIQNPFIWGHVILIGVLISLVPGWDNETHIFNNITNYAVLLFGFIANQMGIFHQSKRIWVKLVIKKLKNILIEMKNNGETLPVKAIVFPPISSN